MTMNKNTFSDLDETGFRIKAARIKNRLRVAAVSEGRVFDDLKLIPGEAPRMTSSSYNNIEGGKGSLISLSQALSLVGLTSAVKASYVSTPENSLEKPVTVQVDTSIVELRDLIKKVRLEKRISVAELARRANTTYSSVVVFESKDKVTVYSACRYLEALDIAIEITVTDLRDNKIVNPSEDMPIMRYEKLVVELAEFRGIKNRDSAILSPTAEKSDAGIEVRTPRDFMVEIGDQLKNIRIAEGLSRNTIAQALNVSESMIMNVENGSSSIASTNEVAGYFGKRIQINFTGKKIEDIENDPNNMIKLKKVEADELTGVLNDLRLHQGYTVSAFAREIGTTFRSVNIFPTVSPHKKSLMRYIDGLNVRLQVKLVKA